MKKQLLLLIAFVLSAVSFQQASASTFAKFAVYYGIIRVMPQNPSGVPDSDSVNLFRAMNVPVKDSFLGPGKVIESKDHALQFICANRNQAGYECSIFIQPSNNSVVNPFEGVLQYKATGAEADQYSKQFFTYGNGTWSFTSVENNFSVKIAPGDFEVSFHQAP